MTDLTPPEQGGYIYDPDYCIDMKCPHQVLGKWHYAHKDLNNESLNNEAAQPTTPSHDGESKATNE